jgi:hydrogenase expression/formation protein HypD
MIPRVMSALVNRDDRFEEASSLLERFQDRTKAEGLVASIREMATELRVKIMNVCGTHEHAIAQWGLRSLIPEDIELIAGPGCPVCVCPAHEIKEALALARNGVILTTFGDMLRVRTQEGSLLDARSEGARVKLVYSALDALKLAADHPDDDVVFFSVGFETTSAPTASLLVTDSVPRNFSILTSQRLTPPAVEFLCRSGDNPIDAFIAPGHVSCIIGARGWKSIPEEFGKPTVVTGFEPLDILLAIRSLLAQIREHRPALTNEYTRTVGYEGNIRAQEVMNRVFEVRDCFWRGIGVIGSSGLFLRDEFRGWDAREKFNVRLEPQPEEDIPPGCSCGLVLLGRKVPTDCPLFGTECTPLNPFGPCMVSQEGTCLIWYKFKRGK